MKKYASTANIPNIGYKTHKGSQHAYNPQGLSGNSSTYMLKENKLISSNENANQYKKQIKENQYDIEASKENFNQNTNQKFDRMSKKKLRPVIEDNISNAKPQLNNQSGKGHKNAVTMNTFNSPRNLYLLSGTTVKDLKDRIMGKTQYEVNTQSNGQKKAQNSNVKGNLNLNGNVQDLSTTPSNSSLAYKNYFLKSNSTASLYTNKYINSSMSKSPKALQINNYLVPGKPDARYAINSPKFSTQATKESNQNVPPYTNLKNKIDSIAGKLQEIKKDYEISQKQRREVQNKAQKGFSKQRSTGLSKQKNSVVQQKENSRSLYNQIEKNTIGIDTQQKQKLVAKSQKQNGIKQQASKVPKNRREQSQQKQKQRMKSKSSIFKIQSITQDQPEKTQLKRRQSQKTPKMQKKEDQQKLEKFITKYDPTPQAIKKTKVYELNHPRDQPQQQQKSKKPNKITQCTSERNLFRQNIQNSYKESQKSQLAIDHDKEYYISSILRAFATKNPSTFDSLCRSHIQSSIEILNYMKDSNMITKALSKKVQQKVQKLPSSKFKTTIIFDLDETLIHCNDSSVKTPCDIVLPIKFPDSNHTIKAGVNIRPYAQQCLKQLSKHFEIMVFTASHQFYANVIIDYLDPKQEYVSYRFFRDSCHKTEEGFYVKDLRVIDRPLKNILLVDNAAYSYGFQPENGIPIVPFYDNKTDFELKTLVKYLITGFSNDNQSEIDNNYDVRVKNSQIMKINRYAKYQKPQKLVNQLYL